MNLLANVTMSVEVLTAHKMRTTLSLAGIIVGVASVIIMIAVGLGAEQRILERIQNMGTNLVMVSSGKARLMGGRIRRIGQVKTLKLADARAIESECPAVESASASTQKGVNVRYGLDKARTSMIGLEPSGFSIRNVQVASGRGLDESDERARSRVAVIGPKAAENIFGERQPVGQFVYIGKLPFRIVGLAQSKGADLSGADQDDVIYVPLQTALRRVLNQDYVETVFLRAAEPVDFDAVEGQVTDLLRRRHKLGMEKDDDFTIHNQSDLIKLESDTSRSLTMLIGGVAGISWLVGGLGIFAVMLISVRERRGEIGLRRAIGATASDIRRQFLIEAAILAGAGGLIGLILGLSGIWLVSLFDWWPLVTPWRMALSAVIASAALGVACGIKPASRAANLTPVAALQAN